VQIGKCSSHGDKVNSQGQSRNNWPQRAQKSRLYQKFRIAKLYIFGLPVVSSPPATEEIGAMGREIESRQAICT
jgi:hypothetical protein